MLVKGGGPGGQLWLAHSLVAPVSLSLSFVKSLMTTETCIDIIPDLEEMIL